MVIGAVIRIHNPILLSLIAKCERHSHLMFRSLQTEFADVIPHWKSGAALVAGHCHTQENIRHLKKDSSLQARSCVRST